MATGFTTSKASTILNAYITSKTYIALSTTTPTKAGGNFTEPAASTGYARHLFGTVDASIAGQVSNKEIVFLFECTGDIADQITHVGLADSTTGTPFLLLELATPVTISKGYVPLIRKNQLIVGLDVDAITEY